MNTETAGPLGHHVQVTGAVKRYGACAALGGVDFEVTPGEFLVLLGPSGSGKSTLVRSLAGIERLDEGEVRLSGQLASAGSRHLPPERRNLAMVFQDYALWPHLTVLGNVGYALRRRHLNNAVARERVQAVLERVGLARYAERYPHELSGGEQQRVALARAVVAQPQLLLFDEPLSNLDADLRERLRVEIATLTRESGASAVYITHDQSEAFALADKIGVLDKGKLIQLAGPEEVYRRPATPFVARFTGVAGELPGRVVHKDYEHSHIRVGDIVIRARSIGPVRGGDSVRLLVRPAATRIVADPDGSTEQPTSNVLRGEVIDVAYRGRGYDHVIAAGPHLISAVYDGQAHPRGAQVTVDLDPDHCLAYTTDLAGQADSTGYPSDLTAVSMNPAVRLNAGTASEPARSSL
ncbi:MAG TPA: ABC transporter ATP-binding protein [Jatrophihabitans sp.]|jgi:ABC-type Fe3+/spermidine/putrescine transport system ATPase subunit